MIHINRKDAATIGIIAAMFVASWLLFPSLPESIPTHWNADGVADGHGPPLMAFFIPAITAIVYVLLSALPMFEPEKRNIAEFYSRHGFGFKLAMVAFFGALHALTLAAALGQDIHMSMAMPLMIGGLIAYIGWIIRDAKRMYLVGFRTPWALADERNWRATHRFGGNAFIVAGAFCALASLSGVFWLSIGAILAATLATFVYSYLAFRGR